ncbi:MAG TPA: tRNA-dihydrouridine synthase [Candidatus Saccharimonadia bacterium]|nr:tRNA-dihydrouridine synthase [Candidatus Saccharimonadia bacterium]
MKFWQQLPQPFFVLAPMDDVTDVVFRQLIAEIAPPDVFMTEFVSVDGLQSAGRTVTLERLRIAPGSASNLVAQIWGNDPERFYRSAQDIAALGFAGIDINMGCPEKGIVARGCGGGLIGHPDAAADIIAATKAGAPHLPVSVKTRLGLGQPITEDWAGFLLGQDLAALTIHGRTVREMSKVPAHWDEIAKVVRLRNQLAVPTKIIGNGDIESRAHGLQLASDTGVDGLMIGRGIFHDPFIFDPAQATADPQKRLAILLRHVELYEQWGSTKSFQTLKKFFKIYANSWPGAAELRAELMETSMPAQTRGIIAAHLGKIQ